MKAFVAGITFLLVTLFMMVFYGIVSFVIGALWGFDVTFGLAIRCGITAYILSIVLPMIFTPAISKE